jgi:F1F0 ATPase subunit 2
VNALAILIRLLGGLAVGIFFYGGLWFTVNLLAGSRYRAWLLLGSFGIRTLVVVSGFLLMIERRWDYALWCLIGFTVGRLAVVKFMVGRGEARAKCT